MIKFYFRQIMKKLYVYDLPKFCKKFEFELSNENQTKNLNQELFERIINQV